MTGAASFPSFIARRFALLLFTLLLVPSLSFVMFTLIQGDHTAPLDMLDELGDYHAAVFLQGGLGSGNFRGGTFIRTRSALGVVMDGFLVDCYLLGAAIALSVLGGLLAGAVQATHPRSLASRCRRPSTGSGSWCCCCSRPASARSPRSRSSPPSTATATRSPTRSGSCTGSGCRR